MKKIFVCAGMGIPKNQNIIKQAQALGFILAANNNIVYAQGGSCAGLMGETLKQFIKSSNNVEFFIPDTYYNQDSPALIKLVGEENFKATVTHGELGRLEAIKSCDQVIVLPGGSGTVEELLFCNETARSNEFKGTLTLVNIDGFYNGLLQQIMCCTEQGLSKISAIKFQVVNDVNELNLDDIKMQRN